MNGSDEAIGFLPSHAQTVPKPRASAKARLAARSGLNIGGVYISYSCLTYEPPGSDRAADRENAADRIRRQGRQSQTQTSAHTAMVRRRRAMTMVAVVSMGA